jgi:AcrR family transcriptional regulator
MSSRSAHTRPFAGVKQARRTRLRILDIAECRFLRDGYAAATIAAIVGDAGISPDLIYTALAARPAFVKGKDKKDRPTSGGH